VRSVVIPMLCLTCLSAAALAQDATTQAATEPGAEEEAGWAFSASAYYFFVPHTHGYVQPTFTADRDWLHLEARYNYEDQNTASVWAGYNFSGGKKLEWEITPMIGGVFGDANGVAPGYKGSLTWGNFELYSEGEYVFDTNESSDSFFYNWSELTYSPTHWFRFGVVAQRTRAYDTDRDIQRGLLVGFTYKRLDFSAYVLNPDESDPVVAIAARLDF